jgi:hypothetical protein
LYGFLDKSNEIVYNTPYARFLYMGKVMLDDRGSAWALPYTQNHVTDRNLTYSKEGHSKAGDKWYERSKEDNLDKWIETFKKALEGS